MIPIISKVLLNKLNYIGRDTKSLTSGQVVQLDQKRSHAFKKKVSFQFINKKKKKSYIIFYQSVL